MKQKTKYISKSIALAVAAASLAADTASHGQGAMASISGTPVSGGYDYTIMLTNTGSLNLEGFWYAWTDSGNNLAVSPSDPANTLGWGNSVFNSTSIRWQGSSGDALAPGDSGIFTFFSPTAPAAITTDPSGESVVYTGTIGFNESEPGNSSPVFSPALVTVPEPAPLGLAGMGLAALVFGWRRRQKCGVVKS